jgi:methyl-accepting chemotaxis protein
MFSNISVAKKIGILSLLTLISLATIAIVNLVFLNSIKKNASVTEANVVLLKEQTIKLLELSKAIQQGIFVVKAEGFSSIVAKKSVYTNEEYKMHKKRVLELCKELDNFIVTYKKDDKELKELSDTINKKMISYLATIEMFQSDLEDDYKYTISTLDTQVKPKENTLIDSTNQILEKVTKKFNSTFSLMEESSIKTTNDVKNLNIIVMIVILSSLIVIILFSTYLIKKIKTSLNLFQQGLDSFFQFLNKEKNHIELIGINSKDEFGIMAKILNHNIEKTKKLIDEDDGLIEDAKAVMKRVNNGWYSQLIEKNTSNLTLQDFKNDVNQMIINTKDRFVSINDILGHYSKNDYTKKLQLNSNDEKGGVLEALVNGINRLQETITALLIENKSNGLTLEESSNILLSNVNKLNISSNEAAASLEETAAALEEVTSNIRNNTENISKMTILSNEVTISSSEGEKLAKQTTVSMDEINVQVNAINEAISVIDQIAFQTNILSLNAAVEAATAGEAGRGFAVVAAEVRNLASRSADAAKEIKAIVGNATLKANQGKNIANSMIEGYGKLNENIQHTINLISDIQNASKEQLLGIEQINDAVTQLDHQTQQNAQIASQAHDVAVVTDDIAKLIVSNANEKEFLGKSEVKSKNIKKDYATPKKEEINIKENIKVETKITNSKKDEDEWESF